MGMTNRDEHLDPLAQLLEQDLLHRYGPVIGQADLCKALGYKSADAFRQALARGVLPVPVFAIAHRRGKFALAKDIAQWIAQLRHQAPVSARGSGRSGHSALVSAGNGAGATSPPHPGDAIHHDNDQSTGARSQD